MAIDLTKPFDVTYPVNFYSGGDTTKDAFGKHIQEIERIYGILNAINADKLSASELTTKLNAHINSSNPHPNLNINNTLGDLPVSRVSGNWPTSRLSGNLEYTRINGLSDYVSSFIPADKGYGIVDYKILDAHGYQKFGNNFMIQWGRTPALSTNVSETTRYTVIFPTSFTTLYAIFTQMHTAKTTWDTENRDIVVRVMNKSASGFTFFYDYTNPDAMTEGMYISFLALGSKD